jgi:hypothetical protein
MVGGSHWVLWLFPPLKLVAMILLKLAFNTINQIKSSIGQTLGVHITNPILNNSYTS